MQHFAAVSREILTLKNTSAGKVCFAPRSERNVKIENNKNKEKNRERLAKLFEEKERVETIINEFAKKICWKQNISGE